MKVKIQHIIALLFFQLALITSISAQQKPDWLLKRPTGGRLLLYGIGEASLGEDHYQAKAKERALSDIASQIEVTVQSNSALSTTSNNDNVSRSYNQTIQSSSDVFLVGQSIYGTYQDASTYYVCFELNKLEYDEYLEKQREKAKSNGITCLNSAQNAITQGNLTLALEMYSKGLEAVQAYLSEDLEYQSYGMTRYLGKDLLEGIVTLWDGVTFEPSVKNLDVVALESLNIPIQVNCMKSGVALSNLPVTARFEQGSGQITQSVNTNVRGNSLFTLTQVSSKKEMQFLAFGLDQSQFRSVKGLPSWIREKCNNSWRFPEAKVTLKVTQKKLTAYVEANPKTTHLKRTVESIIARNYFDIAQNKVGADLVIQIDGEVYQGEIVPSGLYDLRKYFTTATVKLINQHTNASITDVTIQDVPTLVKEGTPKGQAEASAWRTINSKLSQQLSEAMKGVSIALAPAVPEPTVDANPVQSVPQNQKPAPPKYELKVINGLLAYYNFQNGSMKNQFGESVFDGVPQGKAALSFKDNGLSPSGKGVKLSNDSYIALPSHPLVDNGPYSISVWVKTTSGGVILGRSFSFATTREPGVLGIQNNGHFFVTGERNTKGIDLDANQLVLDGNWHHLCLITQVKDSSHRQYQLYVDSQIVAQGVSSIEEVRSGRTGFIGHMENQPKDFSGEIDNLRIYEKALTSDEVSQLFINKQ